MNVKYFYILAVLMMFSSVAMAQDKKGAKEDVYKKSVVVRTFRTYMKEKKYAQAKNEIDGAMKKYGEAAADAELYRLKADAVNELIGAENKKIYLKQKPDTAQYFNYMYELYTIGLACDESEQKQLDASAQDGKKKAGRRYRYEMGAMMHPYRKNLLSAGKFHYRKRDYVSAYKFLDMYAKTKNNEVFLNKEGKSMVSGENDMTEVATLSVLSAYASSNHKGVMSYLAESLKDKGLEEKMLEIGSKSAIEIGDTTEMVNLLENGFYSYPANDYFFVTLSKYYNDHGMFDKALLKAMVMTEKFPDNHAYWYMKGKEEMLLSKYEEAIESFKKCVALNADDAESYSSLGNIYLHLAQDKYSHFNLSLSDPDYAKGKKEITEYYQLARDNFEAARKLREDEHELWLDGLREVYYKLNKGRELKSLEKYK